MSAPAGDASAEIAAGSRFAFGANWRQFLELLDEGRIHGAEASLTEHLGPLPGLRFLDAGCGSGLFSLAAARLGATVTSFDFDPDAVRCVEILKERHGPAGATWEIRQGSVLDEEFLASLGTFDVVYSWGVLHHTGDMWRALDLVTGRVCDGGALYIAIYNDQGRWSRYWRGVKRTYNNGGPLTKRAIAYSFAGVSAARGRRRQRADRGMDWWRDIVDWVGGYPFEVARPSEIFDFCVARGLTLEKLDTVVGLGCNQFVFRRTARTA